MYVKFNSIISSFLSFLLFTDIEKKYTHRMREKTMAIRSFYKLKVEEKGVDVEVYQIDISKSYV